MDAKQPVFTVADIAHKLKVDPDTVRRLFTTEPDVVVLHHPSPGKRAYRTLRIPSSVLLRVLTRLTLGAQWTLSQLEEPIFTPDEIAGTLKLGVDTVRRLFAREAGVLTICFPRPATRTYRTLRIPHSAFASVMQRLSHRPTPESDEPSNEVLLLVPAESPIVRSRKATFAAGVRNPF